MITFIRQAFWTSLITNISSTISFFGIAILARFISPETFGIYMFCLAFREIICAVCSPSLSQTYLFSDGTKIDFKNVFKINLLFSFFILIASIFGGIIIAKNYGEFYLNLIILFGFLSIINNYSSLFLSIGEKKMNFKSTQFYRSLTAIISLIITCISAFYFGDNLKVLILKEISYSFFLLFFSIFFYNKFENINRSINKNNNFKKLFNYTIRSYFPRLTEILSYKIFDILTANLLGKNLLGLFNQTLNVIKIPYRFLGAITDNILFVHIKIKKNKKNKVSEFCSIQYLILIIILPTIVIFNFFNYEVINLILGVKWIQTSEIIGLLSMFVVILPFYNSLTTLYQALDNQRFYTLSNCLILTTQLIGVYFLPKNIENFIFTFCFSFLFAAIFLVININKNIDFDRIKILKILLIIMSVIALIILYYYLSNFVILFCLIIIWLYLIIKNMNLILSIIKQWKN